MALSDYVTVAITQTSAGPTLPGFGVPLIPSYSATWTERTRVYANLAAVAIDFPVTTSPEYLAATAIFSANPAPSTVMIGRMANKPTKVLSLSALTPTTQASYTYTLQVRGQGFPNQNVTFTSSGSPTDALWAAGIVAALNAVASKNFTAAGAASQDTSTILTAAGNGDLIDTIKTNAYTRTSGFYHPFPSVFADFAQLGKCLPFTPGSETWKFKTLAGVPTFPMTATQRANIVARNGNSYESVAGLSLTFNGQVGSGNFIDVTRGLDALTSDILTSVFGTLAGAAKIPYTDPGIGAIEAALRGSLKRYTDKGVLAASPAFTVTVPLVANVSAADKTSRTLNNVFFTGKLAGAVHSANIIGSVSA